MNRHYKKHLIIIWCITISGLLICSCNKFLDKKSNNILIVPSDINDGQELLDDETVMNLQTTPSYGETSATDYFLLPSTLNTSTQIALNWYLWVPYDYNTGDWPNIYTPIYNANLSLELTDKTARTPGNSTAWDNVKGSALFYRAYYFSWLAWTYAKAYDSSTATSDLGIMMRLVSDFNVASYRVSVSDSYKQIISDATEAAALLPNIPANVMRPSKAAAYGLLARVYLSMRNYGSALLYADSALQLKNNLMDFNGSEGINGSVTGNVPFTKFNKEIIFYSEMSTGFTNLQSPSRAKIDTLLYASYDLNDLRKQAYFKPNTGYYQFKGSYANSNTTPNTLFTGIAVDEIYLIRAECYARDGETERALDDLNTLLKSRWKSGAFVPVAINGVSDLTDTILAERRKELLMRGLRWMDIKRLNKEGRNITLSRQVNSRTYQLQPNSDYYALPLPNDIINLSGVRQNPYNE